MAPDKLPPLPDTVALGQLPNGVAASLWKRGGNDLTYSSKAAGLAAVFVLAGAGQDAGGAEKAVTTSDCRSV